MFPICFTDVFELGKAMSRFIDHVPTFFSEILQIREDWKYVAMVIDRLQLYVFFAVTTAGTIGILINAPHIFEYVDQDKVVQMYRWETS